MILDLCEHSAEDNKSDRKHEWQPNREPSHAGIHGQPCKQFAQQERDKNARPVDPPGLLVSHHARLFWEQPKSFPCNHWHRTFLPCSRGSIPWPREDEHRSNSIIAGRPAQGCDSSIGEVAAGRRGNPEEMLQASTTAGCDDLKLLPARRP